MDTDAGPRSIIIPAHNEAHVVGRTLHALLGQGPLAGVQVVVACNGCSDATAEVARAAARDIGVPVRVLEIPQATKTGAIRAAETELPNGPRLFLDADSQCSGATAAALLAAVGSGGAHIAVPSRTLDLSSCSRPARLYHRAAERLPWVRDQLSGRAAYALSAELRGALGTFPDVIADDRWATTRRPRSAAVIVAEHVTVMPAPRLRDLVVARTRVYAGNTHDDVPAHDATSGERLRGLLHAARQPRDWPGLALFVGVNALAKRRARRYASATGVPWRRPR